MAVRNIFLVSDHCLAVTRAGLLEATLDTSNKPMRALKLQKASNDAEILVKDAQCCNLEVHLRTE